MKCKFFVFLIAIAATIATYHTMGQSPAMTKGVSVLMASTTSAAAFPDADKGDARIVTVTANGRFFFGVKPVGAESLAQEMKSAPGSSATHLYIKADSRVPFEAVNQALHAAHADSFASAVLLTTQSQAAQGTNSPPVGLEVRLGVPSSPATVVQLQHMSGQKTHLKINSQDLPWSQLQLLPSVLQQQQPKQDPKLVVLEADGKLPFDEVVKVIDFSRSIGADVAMSLPNQ